MKSKIFLLIIVLILLCIGVFAHKQSNINVIKFSSWGSQSEVEVIKSVINDFEKGHSDIRIDFIHIPQNYYQKLHLLYASGLEPDVIFINNQNIPLYIQAGLLENLNNYFTDAENIFFKESLNCFKKDGNLYAIPRDISNLVLYYNKDIFKNAGVKLPKEIKDIFELKDILIKVTDKEHFGINYEELPLYWLYYLASNGGGILSDDGKNIIITKPESIQALNLYSDFVNKYKIAPTKAQIGSMTTAQMFINGKLAVYLSGRWMIPKFRETLKFDWDIAEFPSSIKNKVYIDSSGWAISKNSKNKESAIEFVKYLSSKQVIDKFSADGLIVPARIDSAESSTFTNNSNKPENNAVFIKMLSNAKPTPVTKNYASITDIITEKSKIIFEGKDKPENVYNKETMNELERLL